MCTARALATRVLVGTQPTLTQVPPSSLRSMTAVLRPSLSRRAHSAGAAWPVPITIASNFSAMCVLLLAPSHVVLPARSPPRRRAAQAPGRHRPEQRADAERAPRDAPGVVPGRSVERPAEHYRADHARAEADHRA